MRSRLRRTGPLWVWDLESGDALWHLTGHEPGESAVTVTHGGRLAVSGARDGNVRVWNLENGVEIRRLAHGKYVTAVAMIGDGRYIASGAIGAALKVWDLVEGSTCGASPSPSPSRTWRSRAGRAVSLLQHVSRRRAHVGCRGPRAAWRCGRHPCAERCTSRWLAMDATHSPPLSIAGSGCGTRRPGPRCGSWNTPAGASLARELPDDRFALSGSYDGPVQLWDLERGTDRTVRSAAGGGRYRSQHEPQFETASHRHLRSRRGLQRACRPVTPRRMDTEPQASKRETPPALPAAASPAVAEFISE